jgi:predicted metal-binding membrane protein
MRLPTAILINQRDAANSAQIRHWNLLLWPGILVAAAWAVMLLAVVSRHTEWSDHHYLLQASGLPFVSAIGFFLASWQLMILAMMVPSITPLLRRVAQANASLSGALAMCLAGYDLAWTAFGCVAFFGDALLHKLVESWSWLGSHNAIIATGLLALAGAYQFMPHKARFVMAYHSETRGFSQSQGADTTRLDAACRAGVRTGLTHLGSCWALMLAMFGLGMGNLGWMVALTGVMLAEQGGGPRATVLRWLVGVVFLALAAFSFPLGLAGSLAL